MHTLLRPLSVLLATAFFFCAACEVGDALLRDEPAVEEQPWELLSGVGPGDTVVVDGVEAVVPEPGTGVATNILHDDGTAAELRLETTDDGQVMRFFDGEVVHHTDDIIASGSPECTVGAYSTMGYRWTKKLRWRLSFGSIPSGYNRSDVLGAFRRANTNITHQHNHCGYSDQVSATAEYLGSTSRLAGISSRGSCVSNDGQNVVSFGSLPSGTLAVTCTWYSGGRALSSDMKVNRGYAWYTGSAPPAGCSRRFSLRAVATHERGHTFGLGHVSESRYPYMTMSTAVAPCTSSASSLGWGDIRGLRRLY